jgi:hypothetical protein
MHFLVFDKKIPCRNILQKKFRRKFRNSGQEFRLLVTAKNVFPNEKFLLKLFSKQPKVAKAHVSKKMIILLI